jgi:hypothetical protein
MGRIIGSSSSHLGALGDLSIIYLPLATLKIGPTGTFLTRSVRVILAGKFDWSRLCLLLLVSTIVRRHDVYLVLYNQIDNTIIRIASRKPIFPIAHPLQSEGRNDATPFCHALHFPSPPWKTQFAFERSKVNSLLNSKV